eukprot:TRINITY_DN334_c0_g1_i1.p3 TRINITY_DN334_c0_g1~~TRINITY_DN334_c0_g1_i1.p3  ORF type:complete len:182 (+),score=27.49 TRINITY_DN334_c0_g1_i1:87-632(+)
MSLVVRKVNLACPQRQQVGVFRCSNRTVSRVWAKKSVHPYHVEVLVGEGEPEEAALKRFKRLVNQSGVVQEARRRRRFESTQDRKKRKLQEKFAARKRKFQDNILTYDQLHGQHEASPFQDLFGNGESIGDNAESVQRLMQMASGGGPVGGFQQNVRMPQQNWQQQGIPQQANQQGIQDQQ